MKHKPMCLQLIESCRRRTVTLHVTAELLGLFRAGEVLSTRFRKMCQSSERNDLANASGIPKSDAVRTNEAHD